MIRYLIIVGKILLELTDHTDSITKLSFAPDQSLVMASCSWDGTLKVTVFIYSANCVAHAEMLVLCSETMKFDDLADLCGLL